MKGIETLPSNSLLGVYKFRILTICGILEEIDKKIKEKGMADEMTLKMTEQPSNPFFQGSDHGYVTLNFFFLAK